VTQEQATAYFLGIERDELSIENTALRRELAAALARTREMEKQMSNEREIAASIIRGLATGAGVVGTAGSANPTLGGIAKGVELLLGFVATLVEKIGTDKAAEVLADLSKHPARPITNEELAEDVARVKRELGLTSTPPSPVPSNPYDDEEP
jgi:hypothetical protein